MCIIVADHHKKKGLEKVAPVFQVGRRSFLELRSCSGSQLTDGRARLPGTASFLSHIDLQTEVPTGCLGVRQNPDYWDVRLQTDLSYTQME